MLNNQQKAIIHIAAQQLGWIQGDDKTVYCDVLKAQAGVTSASHKNFSYAGFLRVMAHAKKCGFKKSQNKCKKRSAPRALRYAHLGHRPGFASPAQLRKIEVMWRGAARSPGDQALRSFLRNNFKVGRLEWIREGQVTSILTVIKSMERRS